jgi:hypothetical protein
MSGAQLGVACTRTCGRLGQTYDAADAPTFRTRSGATELGPYSWRLEIRGGGAGCVQAVLGDVVVGATPLDASAKQVFVHVDHAALVAAMTPVVVRVIDAATGVPVAGALVELPGSQRKGTELRTGADGRVRIPLVITGTLVVVVHASGFALGRTDVTRPILPEYVVRLGVGRRVTGRVLDPAGTPLAHATVGVWDEAPENRSALACGADGTFVLDDLPAREFELYSRVRPYPGRQESSIVRVAVDCRTADALDVEIRHNYPAVPAGDALRK